MTKVALAKKFRDIHGQEMPTLKLARIMYNKNKASFKDVEDARATLRYIEGKLSKCKTITKTPDRPRNPYNLPKSEEVKYEPYVIKEKRVLLLSDIHIPYHSVAALTATFNYAKKEKPEAIILNGDTIDFFQLSRFVKDPKMRSFAYELNTFKEFFEVLQKTFKCKVYFKAGNHENRYDHFLWIKAGELEGVDEFKLSEIIKARAEGVSVITDKSILRLGKLNVLHGHEFGQSIFSPVNVARGLYMRGKSNAIQGHSHRSSEHTETTIDGKVVTTWSTGCLCELHPGYLPINSWNWGFAIVDVDGEEFHVRNLRIHKGKVY